MKLLTKIKKLLFLASILIFALSGLSFVVSPRPIIPVAQAACLIPPAVCVLGICVDSPWCALDTGDLKDAGKVALSLAGKGFGEIDDVLAKVASHGGDACAVVVKLAPNLSPVDLDKLVIKYGCDNIPGGGSGGSGSQDEFTGCEEPKMTEQGKDFCEGFSSGQCFWYSGGLNDSPRCVTNNKDMNDDAECRGGGHCYDGQTCQPGNYCSSYDQTPGSTPVPTGSQGNGNVDDCTDSNQNGTWACQQAGCSAGYADTGKTGQAYFQCTDGLTCCIKKSVSIGSGSTGGGGGPAATPTPTPPGDGYCGDSVPTYTTLKQQGNASCATSQATATGNLTWQRRTDTDGSGYDKFCNWKYPDQQRYFYTCAPGTGSGSSTTPTPTSSPTPTPTTFVPISQGGVCNPVQGPWQCQSPNVCLATGPEGRCCPAGTEWKEGSCKTPTATPAPTASTPASTPTPISTGSTCNDYIPASNIHQVCRVDVSSCMGTEVLNSGGNQACSDFYQKPALCCQLPPSAGPAGGACSNPTRECDLGLNTGTGTNISCSGCGGYCVPNATGGKGTCRNPY